MVGVYPMMPVLKDRCLARQTSIAACQFIAKPIGFPFLILWIERHPNVGKLAPTAIVVRIEQLRNFEVVAVLDVKNRISHRLSNFVARRGESFYGRWTVAAALGPRNGDFQSQSRLDRQRYQVR